MCQQTPFKVARFVLGTTQELGTPPQNILFTATQDGVSFVAEEVERESAHKTQVQADGQMEQHKWRKVDAHLQQGSKSIEHTRTVQFISARTQKFVPRRPPKQSNSRNITGSFHRQASTQKHYNEQRWDRRSENLLLFDMSRLESQFASLNHTVTKR